MTLKRRATTTLQTIISKTPTLSLTASDIRQLSMVVALLYQVDCRVGVKTKKTKSKQLHKALLTKRALSFFTVSLSLSNCPPLPNRYVLYDRHRCNNFAQRPIHVN